MNLISGGYVLASVACVTVAVEWLLLGIRGWKRRTHLLFAASALVAAVDAFFLERRLISVQSPEELRAIIFWQTVAITSFLALLALFLSSRTGLVRRPLLAVVLGLLGLAVVVNLVDSEALFIQIESIGEATLPWGETVRFGEGPPGGWRWVGDAANLAFLALLLDTTLRLARSGRRRLARWLGASFFLLSLSVLAFIPTDLGWLRLPPLHPFAFLSIVAVMSWELSSSVVLAADLSKEVRANELRWRQLVQTAQLCVVRLGTDGRVLEVNAYFEDLLGRSAAETVGKPFAELVVPEERGEFVEWLPRLGDASNHGASRRSLIAADGERRVLEWRQIALRGADGEFQGVLSLGADVTERQLAARDKERALEQLSGALEELEGLKERLEEENVILREEIEHREGYRGLVGNSDGLQYVLHRVEQVAGSDASVLILGETGVGKELVARTIHERSLRAGKPFVVMNCAALAPGLVDSELFGHERGAFTGADRQRKGRFELADGGTLFLDEIGELPLDVQPKLLRVLEEGEFSRVGGSAISRADVRLITATNRELREEVAAGRFREDLFYRLEVYPITVPPLRERREDIAPLVLHFLQTFNGKRIVKLEEVPAEVIRQLEAYSWPGNVRELKNVVERAALASTDRVLRLAEPLRANKPRAAQPAPESADGNGVLTLQEVERRHIRTVLDLCGGQVAGKGGAAEKLGMHFNTLRSRMKKLGIVRRAKARRGPGRSARRSAG